MATQRELREAFESGMQCAMRLAGFAPWSHGTADSEARKVYPPKMVTRPREVRASNGSWYRIVNNSIEYRLSGAWSRYDSNATDAIMSLYANPTETVEDDE